MDILDEEFELDFVSLNPEMTYNEARKIATEEIKQIQKDQKNGSN